MNWLLLVVIVILGLNLLMGYHRGFIKTVFSIFSVIIAILVASLFSPYVSKMLQKNDTIYDKVYDAVDSKISLPTEDIKDLDTAQLIEGLELPSSIKEMLKENNNTEIYSMFHISSFDDYVITYITCIIFNGISYMLLFIVTMILLSILSHALNLISKLPILNGINKIGGVGIGLIQGLLVIWIFFIIITVFSGTDFGKSCFNCINESSILDTIYDNNFLMNYIMGLAKDLFA